MKRAKVSVAVILCLALRVDAQANSLEWTRVARLSGRVEDLAFASSGSAHVYAATFAADGPRGREAPNVRSWVWRSLDAGRTWARSSTGVDTMNHVAAFTGHVRVLPARGDTVFTTVRHILHRSIDGGRTWVRLDADSLRHGALVEEVSDIAFANGRLAVAARESAGVLHSDDGGESFYRAGTNVPQNDCCVSQAIAVGIDPNDPGEIYAYFLDFAGGLFLLRGSTWERASPRWFTFFAVSPHTGWLYYPATGHVDDPAPVMRSRNEGLEFEPAARGLEGLPARPVAGTGGDTSVAVSPGHVFAFDPVAPFTVYLGTVSGVYRSLDGGDRWSPLDGSPDEVVLSVAVSDGTPRVLLAGTDLGHIYRVELTADDPPTAVTSGEGLSSPPASPRAFPNPFNGTTTLEYTLETASTVRVRVYSASGQLVRELVDGPRGAGVHAVTWDGNGRNGAPVGSGVYLIRLEAGHSRETRRVLVVR